MPRERGGSSIYYGYLGYSNYSRFGYLGAYNPFYYGGGGWGWGGYGYSSWHDPYLYSPYSYYGPYNYYGSWPYYWDQSSYGGRDSTDDDRSDQTPTGSLRLKVSPRSAKVYVDGALAGTVDEFDGLTSHLRLPVGSHQIELRAEGYVTASLDVTVDKGKTRTERASLKAR